MQNIIATLRLGIKNACQISKAFASIYYNVKLDLQDIIQYSRELFPQLPWQVAEAQHYQLADIASLLNR